MSLCLYVSMPEYTQVKHGHSVDWKDVHERCWQCEPVQDSAMLVELLSVCTSPAKVLAALTKENLCALLKVGCRNFPSVCSSVLECSI